MRFRGDLEFCCIVTFSELFARLSSFNTECTDTDGQATWVVAFLPICTKNITYRLGMEM